jgi:anthranilate phosphoribosyltransferase
MIREAILRLTKKQNLSFNQTCEVFEEMFNKKATTAQIAAFLISLAMKGETEQEISAAASIVRSKALKINVRDDFLGISNKDEPVIDTCGTGGSGVNKFNISTAVSFVVSAAGVKVAKHGNRAMSSSCGSADAFEALGLKIDVAPEVMEKAIKKTGIGFLYAPLYHPALKDIALIRKEMGVRTVFNILGPLCNPAFANYQLLGVYSLDLVLLMARVLRNLGIKRAFVIHGKDLKDEVSLTGNTKVAFVKGKKIEILSLNPSDFGLRKIKLEDLKVNNAKESAKIIKGVLAGEKGAARDIVLANAACCFYILSKVKNLKDGVKLAVRIIDEGLAQKKYREFKLFLTTNA